MRERACRQAGEALSALSSQLSALSSQLSALSSQLSALSSQLSAFSFQLSACQIIRAEGLLRPQRQAMPDLLRIIGSGKQGVSRSGALRAEPGRVRP
ncbi:hypothetical protein DDV93_01085 [Cereibacter johrii]|nr:hypothetical protein DDV93_01085 [Cereibacter johrii]